LTLLISCAQALLKHKAIRGAKRTAVLTQLVARYHKYAEVVPESDSDGEKAPQDGEARRSSRCAFLVCLFVSHGGSAEDESVVAKRGQHSDEERDASDEGAWDYSTMKPSDRAEALPPAPKVSFSCFFLFGVSSSLLRW
jgi:hypothetical protein